jgi:chromate transporter
MMHTELVERRRWISEHRFLHALNYTMVLPGPEAQQLATYIGWLMHGTWAGSWPACCSCCRRWFILIALTWIYLAYGDLPVVAGVLYGIKPAVTAIVVFAAWRIGSRALRNGVLWGDGRGGLRRHLRPRRALPLHRPGGRASSGYIGGRIAPDKFKTGGGHGASGKSYGPALIDDHTPLPERARFAWRGDRVTSRWASASGR